MPEFLWYLKFTYNYMYLLKTNIYISVYYSIIFIGKGIPRVPIPKKEQKKQKKTKNKKNPLISSCGCEANNATSDIKINPEDLET